MIRSRIKVAGGVPTLMLNDVPTSAMAYTTYFPERGCIKDFAEAGYRIFFVNVSFTTAPINSCATGFSPFRVGVFENPEEPDYSEFEDQVYDILRICPDAVIFPRIYVSMPRWWTESHPDDVVPTAKGGCREMLFSDAFRRDGAELLSRLVDHIKAADYADRIGGWQICGGQTQEWFHHDMNGSLTKAAEAPFRAWALEELGIPDASLPKSEDFLYTGTAFNECENARRYSIFSNIGVARSVDHFAKVIKDATDGEQVVGVFYGYSFESGLTVLFGTHALRVLLDSPNLDFFSSPNAYTNNRDFGIDWADMIPVDSVKHHGKLCFIECDIRTYLTTSVQEARPNEYPDDIYRTADGKSVWAGPPTAALSREALRKSFAHQITRASAIWWFDMWGGWYADRLLMDEVSRMKDIYDGDLTARGEAPSPEVVFFADECAYANMLSKSPQLEGIPMSRTAIGNVGAPYDCYMVEDADDILCRYKAAVFPMPIASEAGMHAMELCEKLGIPYLSATAERCALDVTEIRAFLKSSGVHLYTDGYDVVYVGNGYIALHSSVGGKKRLTLPARYSISTVFGTDIPSQDTDVIEFTLEENSTALFALTKSK